jgi:hypothetical protein
VRCCSEIAKQQRRPRKSAAAVAIAVAFVIGALPAAAQNPPSSTPRTILAIGAHAGDMELTAGAVLLKQRQLGDRVVLLHLSLGEHGNP